MLKGIFCDHPAEAGETYAEHLLFTARMSWKLLRVGAALLIHGIFPFLFTTTASGRINKIYAVFALRALHIAERKNALPSEAGVLHFRKAA